MITGKALLRRSLAVGILAALTGCGVVSDEPYLLGRYVPADGTNFEQGLLTRVNDPVTGRPDLSLCYNRLNHKPAQILGLVQKHCSDPQLFYNAVDLYSCSLSAPVRATYSCASLSRTAEEARPNLRKTDSFLGTIQLY